MRRSLLRLSFCSSVLLLASAASVAAQDFNRSYRLTPGGSVSIRNVSGDIEGALPITDHVAMLDKGRIRFVGTPDEFRESDDLLVRAFLERDAMIGTPNMLEAV